MFCIAATALYTTLRKRGTTRQLASVIVICVVSALLLLPAVVWYTTRFATVQSALQPLEIEIVLAYVVLCGWLVPLSVTITYCLYALPRTSSTAAHTALPRVPSGESTTHPLHLPRHQTGMLAPFVYSEETPWGWLEYSHGNFQGQRLALKRAIATIGRDEDSDIWIDDDMASRRHAELAWYQGQVYITDCGSLNGVLLNKRRIRNAELLAPGDLVEIGSHGFIFVAATPPASLSDQDDLLLNHTWRSSLHGSEPMSEVLPTIDLSNGDDAALLLSGHPENDGIKRGGEDTSAITYAAPLTLSSTLGGVLLINEGALAGQRFSLNRPVVTVGRGHESDILINDSSISRRHAQFSRQADGDYVQDLASRNGSKVNGEPLLTPRLLRPGDVICLGCVNLEYALVEVTPHTAPPVLLTPPPMVPVYPINPTHAGSGPVPLKLPSKPKVQ